MSHEPSSEVKFAIGHVLFIDIVGYSKLLMEEQKERLNQLTEIVLATPQVRDSADEQLVRLPTGDGMALVFLHSAEEPARCALQIAEALLKHPELPVRMGIHSGPVSEVTDVSGRTNIAGAGINMAQRVMDCGDAGHILVSRHVAEDLEHYAKWRPFLHDLGECEVKHGVRMGIVNLYTEQAGNAGLPAKCRSPRGEPPPKRTSRSPILIGAAVVALLLLLFAVPAIIFAPALLKQMRASGSKSPAEATSAAAMAASIPGKSIAVLPFENLSEDKSNAYFADGVQDEILTNLARVADLKVISRTSVMQYRDRAARNLREIGQELGVAHVLEGSVQRAAGKIRVNAQLIDARNDAHLWAQTYDRDLADVFAIQSEIARTIAEQLQAKLSPREEAAVVARPTNDLVAYDLYLRAMEIERNRVNSIGSGRVEVSKQQIQLLEQAISRDPAFVSALCKLAGIRLYLHWLNDRSAPHVDLARQALEAAARLQPDAGEVHATRGLLYYRGSLDYERALAEFALARRSLPNDAFIPFFVGIVKRRQGHWEEAIRNGEQALTLDPQNLAFTVEHAFTYLILRRYEEAAKILDGALAWNRRHFGIAYLRAVIDAEWKADLGRWKAFVTGDAGPAADPNELINARLALALLERDYHGAQDALDTPGFAEADDNEFFMPREWIQGIIAQGFGDKQRAESAFLAARERAAAAAQQNPGDASALIVLGQIDAALGRHQDAIREGEHAVELLPVSKDAVKGGLIMRRLAHIYAQTGDANRALDFLEKVISLPNGVTYGELKLDGDFDPLRGNPRFEKLVASLAPKQAAPK